MAIVSVTANLLESKGKIDGKYYYGASWEAEADAPGGVDRDSDNEPWPDDYPTTFWGLIKLFW